MAKKSSGVIRIEYFAASMALAVLGVLPRSWAVSLSIGIMRAVPFVLPGLRRIGRRNLEIAFPQKSQLERDEILRGTFNNLGRVLGELSQFHKFTREKLAGMIDFELDEESKTLYERNRPGRGCVTTAISEMGNASAGFALSTERSVYCAAWDNPRSRDDQRLRSDWK